MYNDNRSFVYNKSFSRYFEKQNQLTIPLEKIHSVKMCENTTYEMFDLIRDWASEKGIYTDGDIKAQKLIELGVSKHWDDDEDEVAAAEEVGIEAVLVPVEEGITDRLRDKWIDLLSKEEEETN